MEKIRCILIDVETESITEVFLEDGLQPIYDALKCETFEAVHVRDNNDIYVDEEGLFKVTPETKFFKYGTSQPLVGNGLITAYDEDGATIDTTMSIEEVRQNVRFYKCSEIMFI